MAQYNLGYSSSTTQAEAWANLKTALNNYSSRLTLTYDEETYIAKAEFKEMSYYVTFRVYPDGNRLYIQITLYDSEDAQITQYQSNAYLEHLYLDVFEAQGDSLIFGVTTTQGDNVSTIAFVDADIPCIVIGYSNYAYIAINNHVAQTQVAGVSQYVYSESAIQMVKVYDSTENAFIDDLYESIIAKNVVKNFDIILASIGQRKFYLFLPVQKSGSNRWLAIECTDKF